MSQFIIGVDLGGTRIRAARMDQQLNIIERVETLTLADEGLEPTLKRINDLIAQVIPEDLSTVAGIGISAPGPLNPETGVIVSPPNLPGWHNVPLADAIRERFDVPIFVGNDANVAALAEVLRGAARGYRHAIYITISTGIGSGIVIDGKMLLGREGLAAELGHTIILAGDRVSSIETEAAGPDMADQARQRIKDGENSLISEMVDGDLEKINGSTVGKAAQQGDKLAMEVVEHSGFIIGLGIVNLLHLFNSEIIVIGGGVSNLGDLIFTPLKQAIKDHCIDEAYWRDLIITTPDLGEDVSIYGAAALVATRGGVDDVSKVVEKFGL